MVSSGSVGPPRSLPKTYPKTFWHGGTPYSPRAPITFGLSYQGSFVDRYVLDLRSFGPFQFQRDLVRRPAVQRINILNTVEQEGFESAPVFNSFQRNQYFDFPQAIQQAAVSKDGKSRISRFGETKGPVLDEAAKFAQQAARQDISHHELGVLW